MKTYTITQSQLFKLECAMTLAEYFTQEQEQGTDQNISDQETLDIAKKVFNQVQEQAPLVIRALDIFYTAYVLNFGANENDYETLLNAIITKDWDKVDPTIRSAYGLWQDSITTNRSN